MNLRLVLISLICMVVSCEQPDIESISSKIIINLEESIEKTDDGYELLFLLETEKIYSCLDYEIIAEESVNSRKVNLKIFGVVRRNPCRDFMSTAKKEINLGIIENGEYRLKITVQEYDEKISGILLVTEENYQLEIEDAENVVFPVIELPKKK